jgi:hypothetical protein
MVVVAAFSTEGAGAAVLGASHTGMKNRLSPVFLDLGRRVVFRKDPPGNSKWTPCLEFAGVDGFRSRATEFFLAVWFQGSVAKLCSLLPLWDMS